MNNLNIVKAPNIKHDSPEVKDVCHFAERVRHMLDVKKFILESLCRNQIHTSSAI
jgi:hypothetical protein